MSVTEWKKRIMRAQSLDDLGAVLNEALEACESGAGTDAFESSIGLSRKEWTNLPVFGPDEWGLPQGVYSWDVRGNVLVHRGGVRLDILVFQCMVV